MTDTDDRGPEDDLTPLQALSVEFAADLLTLLTDVLPGEIDDFVPQVEANPETRRVAVEFGSIPMHVDAQRVLELETSYYLVLRDSSTPTLAVDASSFRLKLANARMPLFTLDFARTAKKGIPASHFNIHAKRDDMIWAMANAGRRHRGKQRRKELDKKGRAPQFSDLHFPTGGARFRPSLEDVLQFAIVEFGIDARSGNAVAIAESRQRWRALQLRAAIGDDLPTTVDELRRKGFEVRAPNSSPGAPREDRVRQY